MLSAASARSQVALLRNLIAGSLCKEKLAIKENTESSCPCTQSRMRLDGASGSECLSHKPPHWHRRSVNWSQCADRVLVIFRSWDIAGQKFIEVDAELFSFEDEVSVIRDTAPRNFGER